MGCWSNSRFRRVSIWGSVAQSPVGSLSYFIGIQVLPVQTPPILPGLEAAYVDLSFEVRCQVQG